jgi:hypothetical protein
MVKKMKVLIKRDFDGKISNSVCHQINELCGKNWTKIEIYEILNSTSKKYLNEIGRKFMVNRCIVNYIFANYILVMPKQFITSTGEQLYVWIYREKTSGCFGKINIGVSDDFEYSIVKNHHLFMQKNSREHVKKSLLE